MRVEASLSVCNTGESCVSFAQMAGSRMVNQTLEMYGCDLYAARAFTTCSALLSQVYVCDVHLRFLVTSRRIHSLDVTLNTERHFPSTSASRQTARVHIAFLKDFQPVPSTSTSRKALPERPPQWHRTGASTSSKSRRALPR